MKRKKELKQRKKKLIIHRIIRIIFALGIAFFLCQIQLDYLESLTYDLRVKLKPVTPVSGHIITVSIDPRTQESLERQPNANDHKKLLLALAKVKPRAVVYAMDPGEIVGSYEELEKFAKATKALNFFVATNRLPVKGLEDEFKLLPPLNDIHVVSGPETWDRKIFAKDNVTRRLIFSFQNMQLLHALLANTYNGFKEEKEYGGLFKFKRTMQAYVDFRPTGAYTPTSFLDIIEDNANINNFKDKIVIIGRDTKSIVKDYILTPYSRDILAMTTTEMHANMIDTLIQNTSPRPSPKWLDILFTSIISILTVFVVLTVKPTKGLLILGTTVAVFTIFSFLIFSYFHFWIGMAHPLLAIFICYYFFIPYRLIIENRRSWEYYERNNLLTQVEELKSNFLRMMSHDLKTPLARIQGMAEMVMADESSPVSKQQKVALTTIRKSSEELSDFIGSILDIGRIESTEIKLMLKSKDVNAIFTDVLAKTEFLAKEKNIDVIAELEPMFSLRLDPDLIRQVFTNLVENAIKYSPNNSKILVSTEEMDGRIIIQVADQGIGIPKDEVENVFVKFYRSSEVTKSPVNGSGLGLYLAKYFVELHKGKISVESELNRGSTFTVELPMDL